MPECPNPSIHANPRDYIPVCPVHSLPLVAAEAGHGQCLWQGRRKFSEWVDGHRVTRRERCITFGPKAWHWLPRDLFNADQIPPGNGYTPPSYDHTGPAWGFVLRTCPHCNEPTKHVTDASQYVCTECGASQWLPAPMYADGA